MPVTITHCNSFQPAQAGMIGWWCIDSGNSFLHITVGLATATHVILISPAFGFASNMPSFGMVNILEHPLNKAAHKEAVMAFMCSP
jgi:hypothetical protein